MNNMKKYKPIGNLISRIKQPDILGGGWMETYEVEVLGKKVQYCHYEKPPSIFYYAKILGCDYPLN